MKTLAYTQRGRAGAGPLPRRPAIPSRDLPTHPAAEGQS